MSAKPIEMPKMPATGQLAYKGDLAAATAVDVSERTIRRAVSATDPTKFPPPLRPDGRYGTNGPRAYLAETLVAWVKSCVVFDV